MLNWSATAVNGTVGVGGIGMLAIPLFAPGVDISVVLRVLWPAFAVAMLPAAVFLFSRPDLMPARIARILQSIAIVWYFLFATLVLAFGANRGFKGEQIPFVFCILLGAWPCALAAYKLSSCRGNRHADAVSASEATQVMPSAADR